jgi:hypothetical protein
MIVGGQRTYAERRNGLSLAEEIYDEKHLRFAQTKSLIVEDNPQQ